VRRGFWFVAGAGTAAYAMVRGRRAAEALTVDGMKDRLGALGLGVRMLRDEVAQGRVEKETELRERLGLVPHGTPELTRGRHPAVAPPTTGPERGEEGSS
jgi:hypothetical protein